MGSDRCRAKSRIHHSLCNYRSRLRKKNKGISVKVAFEVAAKMDFCRGPQGLKSDNSTPGFIECFVVLGSLSEKIFQHLATNGPVIKT